MSLEIIKIQVSAVLQLHLCLHLHLCGTSAFELRLFLYLQVHYSSKMAGYESFAYPDSARADGIHLATVAEDVADSGQPTSAAFGKKSSSFKKANLYAWVSLQQLPEVLYCLSWFY